MTSVDAADRTVARARPDASSGRQAGRQAGEKRKQS